MGNAFKDVSFLLKFVAWILSLACLVLHEVNKYSTFAPLALLATAVYSYAVLLTILVIFNLVSGKLEFFEETYCGIGAVLQMAAASVFLYIVDASGMKGEGATLVFLAALCILASSILLLVAVIMDLGGDFKKIFTTPASVLKVVALWYLVASGSYISFHPNIDYGPCGIREVFFVGIYGGILMIGVLVVGHIVGKTNRLLSLILVCVVAILNFVCAIVGIVHSSNRPEKHCAGLSDVLSILGSGSNETLTIGILCLITTILLVIDIVFNALKMSKSGASATAGED